MKKFVATGLILIAGLLQVRAQSSAGQPLEAMAAATLDSLYVYYSVEDSPLLRENYPHDPNYRADYLASGQGANSNPYSYLWPFSGTLSAVAALLDATGEQCYKEFLDNNVMPGLERYYDSRRQPAAYASYVGRTPSDRFYDDNVWIGIDFTDIYLATGDKKYLEKAEEIWKFILSGTDDVLGGGIYWCEQKKTSKNTCSNAPGTVYACKLYKATDNEDYLRQAEKLYDWTRKNLRDPADGLYWDNKRVESGGISTKKFSYNSGQMIQAGVLLYNLTGEKNYLKDAQETAAAGYTYFLREFTTPAGETLRRPADSNLWFTAVWLRGLAELYRVDRNPLYMDAFVGGLNYAWAHARSPQGLIYTDWSGRSNERYASRPQWLLNQAAMVEMMARTAAYKKENQQTTDKNE